MRILVTGGCGYKGSVLVPKLLDRGYDVIVLDTLWFGNYLQPHSALKIVEGDIRDTERLELDGVDAIIHLASIANDPSGDLDPKLTWEVAALATMRLADKALRSRVSRIIYASSGSVYGLKSEPDVTEDLPLVPLTEYNKTKMVAERVLLSYARELTVQILRPATVCGVSPRMRLDVAVNLLTMQALTKGQITVLGGDQVRPNIHIDDITDSYLHLLDHPELTGVFNAGFENITIAEIAERAAAAVGATITVLPSNDPRSYRLNSEKLLKTGFEPKKTVAHAIAELIAAYQAGHLKDDDRWYNLRWMRRVLGV